MSSLEERIALIEERNQKVSIDKAWETSWTRRGLVSVLTYVCATVLLLLMGQPLAWLSALVPVAGYLVSTLSLPVLKSAWAKHQS